MNVIKFQGLKIRIENEAGSTRSGIDSDGKPWKTTMAYPYGEIIQSMGIDGDPVDVFIGPDKGAEFAYVIHQSKKDGLGFDEDKCMLGFADVMAAKAAFFKSYDVPEFFWTGDVSVIPMAEFKKKVLQTRENPSMIRASVISDAVEDVFNKKTGKKKGLDAVQKRITDVVRKTSKGKISEDDLNSFVNERMNYIKNSFKKLNDPMKDKGSDRVDLIDKTENKAAKWYGRTKGQESGTYKVWVDYDGCDDCSGNADDGPIPVDDDFSSGDYAPPAHPNCQCELQYVRDLDAMSDNPSAGNPFSVGDPVTVDGMHGRGVIISIDGRRVTVKFRNQEYLSRDYKFVHSMTEGNYKSRYSSLRGHAMRRVKAFHESQDDTMTHDAYKNVMWGVDEETGEILPFDNPKLSKQRKKYRKIFHDHHEKYVVGGIVAAQETIPDRITEPNKRIEKVGTQYCIRSDGQDGNFGCWPSKEKAQAVMSGKSFIEPDLPDNLYAGGMGSGRKKTATKEYQRVYKLAQQAGFNQKEAHKVATEYYLSKLSTLRAGGPGSGRKKTKMTDFSLHSTTTIGEKIIKVLDRQPKSADGWGQLISDKRLAEAPELSGITHDQLQGVLRKLRDEGHIQGDDVKEGGQAEARIGAIALKPGRGGVHLDAGGPGSGRKPSLTRGLSKWKSPEIEDRLARKNPKQQSLFGPGHVAEIQKKTKEGKITAESMEYGEPLAGALQHAHLDTNLWFHPPSLKKPTRVPADNPGEKNNRFGDVDKRKSKDTTKQRMDLLKKSAPGGLPANIPVRTTLISPVLPAYSPLMASAHRRRRQSGGGNFRAYGAARI